MRIFETIYNKYLFHSELDADYIHMMFTHDEMVKHINGMANRPRLSSADRFVEALIIKDVLSMIHSINSLTREEESMSCIL